MVEINCETDFVAREQDFRGFAAGRGRSARWPRKPADARGAAGRASSPAGESVEERRRALVAKIGENISVRRFAVLEPPAITSAPTCTARASARWWRSKGGTPQLAHDLAMHVAASNPRYISQAQVPAEVVAKEREILTEQAQSEGKPPEIVAKMVEGRLRKSLGEITLAGQPFVKDPDQTIEKLLKGAKARGAARSSASRSAPASRRSRRTSSPRSWRRSERRPGRTDTKGKPAIRRRKTPPHAGFFSSGREVQTR